MNWDNVWKEKKYTTDFSIRWLDFLSKRGKNLSSGAKILEAGCGSGEGIAVLADKNRTAIGLDLSEEALARTSSHEYVTAVKGDILDLPFPDNTFDLVFNSGVIEHYRYPGNIRQVKEMARVTKKGGEILISVPNSLCLWYILVKKILLIFKAWKFGYEESYTPARLKKVAKKAGLRIISMTGFLCMPPLATNTFEILPLALRKKIALVEKFLPFRQFYCYSLCILCKKD